MNVPEQPIVFILGAEAVVIAMFLGTRIRYWQDRALRAEAVSKYWEQQARGAWKTLADLPPALKFAGLWKKCAKYQWQYGKFLEKTLEGKNDEISKSAGYLD